MARTYLISVAAILLVLVFGISFNSNTITTTTTTAIAQQQQQVTGTIKGMGTSEIPLRVCSNFYTKDFLTVKFDASFLLSSDGKTGKVTSGTGILKTTDSGAFAYLSITGGDINISVEPKLYTLKGTATFQSPSYCNPPSTVVFSIAKPDGTQLKCGNSDLITFNSISLTGSVSGNVSCTTIIDTIPPPVTASPKGGTFNTSPISVTLTSNEPSTTIYYTTDGSTPSLSSTKYTGPITISSTTNLKFFGVDAADNKGTVVQTETYTIDTTPPTVTDTIPPTVTATLTPKAPDGQKGFYVQPVTVTWSGDDGPSGSGISSCDSPTSYSGPDGSSILLVGHCTDKAGNVGKDSITIAYDANPPTINTPGPIIIKESTSPQGAAVTYTVSATDAVDGITSGCFPASGSTFKFGTTTVTCKATDSAGNVAIKTFTVRVQQHTTTNVPSSPSPSPQPQLPQQQLPRLSPTQPTIPVQPGESGQTAIAPPPPLHPQSPSSKQSIPSQPSHPTP